MSYSTRQKATGTEKYWNSVEENHPETSIAEAAAERSAESATESAASASQAAIEASEAKLAAQQAAASASKSAVSIFERAEALQPGGMGMVEVLPLKYLLENNSDATIYDYVSGGNSREYKFSGVKPREDLNNTIVTIKYRLAYQGAKSVIVSCDTFLGRGISHATIEDEYQTLMDDGSKAFLLQAEGQKYKRLFSVVYVQDPGYGVYRAYEWLTHYHNAIGLTQDSMAPYCCAPIFIDGYDCSYIDSFTGLKKCFLHDVYIQEEYGVQYLIIKFETISNSPETLDYKTCYWAELPASGEDKAYYGTERLAIKIHYNPEDFEAEPAQEETSEEQKS